MASTPKAAPRRASRKAADPTLADEAGSPDAAPASKADAQRRDEMIRAAAYAAYLRRGAVPGGETEDWLQAEIEVDRELGEAPDKPAR